MRLLNIEQKFVGCFMIFLMVVMFTLINTSISLDGIVGLVCIFAFVFLIVIECIKFYFLVNG